MPPIRTSARIRNSKAPAAPAAAPLPTHTIARKSSTTKATTTTKAAAPAKTAKAPVKKSTTKARKSTKTVMETIETNVPSRKRRAAPEDTDDSRSTETPIKKPKLEPLDDITILNSVRPSKKKRGDLNVNHIPNPPHMPRPAKLLFYWGAGNFGQFGMGPDVDGEYGKPQRNTWVEKNIKTGSFGSVDAGIESIAAGGMHTLFIDESGKIWSCGVNDNAALGRETKIIPDPENPGKYLEESLTMVPHPLEDLVEEGFRAVQVAAGDSICAAISTGGKLRVWGSFKNEQGLPVFTQDIKMQKTPKSVFEIISNDDQPELFMSVATGNNHLLVLTTYGNLYTWGIGEQGQLGRKATPRRQATYFIPHRLPIGARSRRVKVIGAGNYHSFAVDEDGNVWGWGLNTFGQIGTGSIQEDLLFSPQAIPAVSSQALGGDDKVIQIVGGEHHTVFLTDKGRVFTCGRCDAGQLGLPDGHPALQPAEGEGSIGAVSVPTEVHFPDLPADDQVTQISVGTHCNLAAMQSGALYSWGEGVQSELGLGLDVTEAKTPRMVVRREGGSWFTMSVSAGGQHCIALLRPKKKNDDEDS